MTLNRLGTALVYAYLLRVPLLMWAALVALPWLAVPHDASFGPLLRGLFDLADLPRDSPFVTLLFGPLAFTFVTLSTLMVATAIVVTARLILLNGGERFTLPTIPLTPRLEWLVRIIPALLPICVVGAAWYQSVHNVALWMPPVGVLLAVAVFVLIMRPLNDWLWAQVFEKESPSVLAAPVVAVARLLKRGFEWVVRRTPDGFIDPSGKIYDRHIYALCQLLFSAALYGLLFMVKTDFFGTGPPRVPTLCYVLLLALLAVWAFSGLSFLLDRFRVPLIAVLVVHGAVMALVAGGDHFFRARALQPAELIPRTIDAATVLDRRAGQRAIVVAAEGGGIQAAAWTARVLAGLHQDAQACGSDFDKALVAVSAVSGGAVGTMFVIDAYTNGALPTFATLDDVPAVKMAEASSLDEVARGLAYADLFWTILPMVKGLGTSSTLVLDRGTALEETWKRTPSLATATLDAWRRDLAARRRPAILFNATVAETGQRMLFATTTIPSIQGDQTGAIDFGARHPNVDVQVVTAARLASTFPYVTPPARIDSTVVSGSQSHPVDGGYYDNYGASTLVEWLESGLAAPVSAPPSNGAPPKRALPSRVLILQIRSFPSGLPTEGASERGWIFETLQPLKTLYATRSTGQASRNAIDLSHTKRLHPDLVSTRTIEFPRRIAEARDDVQPPLSWHLTPDDRGRVRDAWNEVAAARRAVQHFLKGDDTTPDTEPLPCVRTSRDASR